MPKAGDPLAAVSPALMQAGPALTGLRMPIHGPWFSVKCLGVRALVRCWPIEGRSVQPGCPQRASGRPWEHLTFSQRDFAAGAQGREASPGRLPTGHRHWHLCAPWVRSPPVSLRPGAPAMRSPFPRSGPCAWLQRVPSRTQSFMLGRGTGLSGSLLRLPPWPQLCLLGRKDSGGGVERCLGRAAREDGLLPGHTRVSPRRKIMDSGELDFYQHDQVCSNTCRSTKIDLSGARVALSGPAPAEYLPLTPATADGRCHVCSGSPGPFCATRELGGGRLRPGPRGQRPAPLTAEV